MRLVLRTWCLWAFMILINLLSQSMMHHFTLLQNQIYDLIQSLHKVAQTLTIVKIFYFTASQTTHDSVLLIVGIVRTAFAGLAIPVLKLTHEKMKQTKISSLCSIIVSSLHEPLMGYLHWLVCLGILHRCLVELCLHTAHHHRYLNVS